MGVTATEIKFVRSLQQKKFRRQEGLFVVEGIKPVTELLESDVECHQVFATEPISFLANDLTLVSNKELERMSSLKTPNKVLALAKIPNSSLPFENHTMLLLDGIKDPGNLGTIIRTAKWFGVQDIVCINDCVDAYDRKVVQSTMGALFHVNLVYTDETTILSQAKQNNYRLAGTDMGGESVFSSKLGEKTLLVIGSESHGMSESVRTACDKLLAIPNFEGEQKVESLNAAIATGIVLAELKRT